MDLSFQGWPRVAEEDPAAESGPRHKLLGKTTSMTSPRLPLTENRVLWWYSNSHTNIICSFLGVVTRLLTALS